MWWPAIYEPDCRDIDVGGLHQAYLATARRAGAALVLRAPLRHAEYGADGWRIDLGDQSVTARLLVNAAGAWADPGGNAAPG